MTFHEYLEKEYSIEGIDTISVDGFPLWRIVRTTFRRHYLGLITTTVKPQISGINLICNNVRSLVGFLKIIINKPRINNVFFPHPRLFYVNNKYMERLSDPIIDYSGIGNDYIILERHQNGTHHRPRYHADKVVYLDVIDSLCKLLAIFFKRYYYRKFKIEVEALLEKLKHEYQIDENRYRNEFVSLLTDFMLIRHLTTPLLRYLKPKRVFFAPRTTFCHVIDFCKKYGVTAIELQHGITIGETTLYSGPFNNKADPDYFLVFGKSNIGEQYAMPLDRVRNIGFPFKNFIKDIGLPTYSSNIILVVSEPSISDKLVCALEILGSMYPTCEFHIRCHPQEIMTKNLLNRIHAMQNVKIVSNGVESFCALSQYTHVVGENSSVLYEAMSLGKKVARLNFAGLQVRQSALIHGGTILDSPKDFYKFLNEDYFSERDTKDLYSDFQIETFNSIL